MYQPPKWPCSYFLKALEFYLTVLFSWISKNVFYLESLWFSTTRKIKFSIKDFFSKCDQIRRKLRTWSHLLKKSSMENFISCPANSGYLENAGERQYCTDCIVKCIAELQIWAKVLLLMVLCRKTFWTLETSVTSGGDGIWNSWVQKP